MNRFLFLARHFSERSRTFDRAFTFVLARVPPVVLALNRYVLRKMYERELQNLDHYDEASRGDTPS